jgi:hypothetical protein
MHNAWFVLWPDGNFSWKFHGNYSALGQILTQAAPRSVSYVAISPYSKHHYFVAFRDQSIKYDFTGAPTEWMKLMTEVFEAWAAERLQKPQQHFVPPHPSPYPSPQLYHPPQPQQQAAHYYNSFVAELPSSPAHVLPMSPPLTPNTPSTGYPSPALSNHIPNNTYTYVPHQQEAVEMPAELPKELKRVSAPLSAKVAPIEKKRRFLSRLF